MQHLRFGSADHSDKLVFKKTLEMERRSFLASAAGLPLLGAGVTQFNLESGTLSANSVINGRPYHYRPGLETARQLPGFLMKFIVRKEDTGGAYSIIEGLGRKGAEPSLHVHEYEDEGFYLIDGEMIVTVGDEDFHMKKGDYIFCPRKVPHTQKFISDTIHAFVFISPGGLEDYFWDLSLPAENLEIPGLPTERPSEEMIQKVIAANKKYGISNVR